ncbi:DUF4232 domain-containing protein [Streptomyces sp. NPDC052052]|uniref:DUF4232 domain-containing protein n=1 Tax=Streptomyces sp. NPDC052052 TaxID=3154756 RepID=UPI0034200CAF
MTQASSPTDTTSATSGRAPSACRPANHTAKIMIGPASAGHHHYRVTLTAPPGYEPCSLAGSPTDVRFYHHGDSLDGVSPGRYGPQHTVVHFGPGRPAHFDIQVPHSTDGTPADEAAFTLRTPDGVIPGESAAYGPLTVAVGTVVGPIQPGA